MCSCVPNADGPGLTARVFLALLNERSADAQEQGRDASGRLRETENKLIASVVRLFIVGVI